MSKLLKFLKKDHIDENESSQQTNQNEFLKRYINNKGKPVDLPTIAPGPTINDILTEIKKNDHEAINKILLETLAPQLSKNEEQKRAFKKALTIYIIVILSIQIAIFLLVIIIFTLAHCLNIEIFKNITIEQLEHLLSFLKYFITAIVAEFIAMLFFIVKFVFDKSIVDLITQLFDKKD